jgi:hypothetical protein
MNDFGVRKSVGRPTQLHPLRRLEQLNAFVRALKLDPERAAKLRCDLRHGSWPVRKVVGRPRSS